MNTYPEVYYVIDIQKILKIGRRQAYELVNSGQFQVIRIGTSIRIHSEVFHRWLGGQKSQNKEEDNDKET